MTRRALLPLVAIAVALALATWVSETSRQLPFQLHGAPLKLPQLSFEDGAGHRRTLADFRGRFVLLNVWATWCVPCREEMPALARLQHKLGGPRFEVIALSVDSGGVEAVKSFCVAGGGNSDHRTGRSRGSRDRAPRRPGAVGQRADR